jgi:hypothetical protein
VKLVAVNAKLNVEEKIDRLQRRSPGTTFLCTDLALGANLAVYKENSDSQTH